MDWIDKQYKKLDRSHAKMKRRIKVLENDVAKLKQESKDCVEMKQRLQARQLVFDFLEALGLFISGSKDKYEFYDKFSVYPSSLNASKIISLCSDNDHAKPRIETATTLFRECNWNTLQDLDKITDDAKSEAFYDAHPNKYDALDKSNDNVSSFLLCIERFKPNKKRKRNT